VIRELFPTFLISLVVVAFQLAVFSTIHISGVVIMLIWLWPLCVGLAGSTIAALLSGVVCGALFDTHVATPFGLSAVVAVIIAYLAVRLGREGVGDLESAAWWVAPVIAATGGVLAPMLFLIAGVFVLDFGLWRGSVLQAMVVNSVAFFLLARPLTRVARWSNGLIRTRR
jgi:cell shape-determining protein MreD